MRTTIELFDENLGLEATKTGSWWTVRLNGEVIVENVSQSVAIHEYFSTRKALLNK